LSTNNEAYFDVCCYVSRCISAFSIAELIKPKETGLFFFNEVIFKTLDKVEYLDLNQICIKSDELLVAAKGAGLV
jgi:hypothetical protein